MKANDVKKELSKYANQDKIKILSSFFKTGKGQYGEGDIFIGVNVPDQRKVAQKYTNISLNELQKLLLSKTHEHRLTALLILTYKYPKGDKKQIFDFYLNNTKYINNWDLVDVTAPKVVGEYLLDNPREVLYKLAKSKNLWEKRIAIVSTFVFIRNNQYKDTLNISEILLKDSHDLIHKAVGWMLREIGKRNQDIEESFLNKHYKHMPRTMLRYSIERFNSKKREFYMKK